MLTEHSKACFRAICAPEAPAIFRETIYKEGPKLFLANMIAAAQERHDGARELAADWAANSDEAAQYLAGLVGFC
jgi:hypothetical protein